MLGFVAANAALISLFLYLADKGLVVFGALISSAGMMLLYVGLVATFTDDGLRKVVHKKLQKRFNERICFGGYAHWEPPVTKEGLRTSRLTEWNGPVTKFPGAAASLLKFKRHEWLMVGLVKGTTVESVWIDKGADKHGVGCSIGIAGLAKKAAELGCDTLISIHNHPNPNSRKYTTLTPSKQDYVCAQEWIGVLKAYDIGLVELICDSGVVREYFREAPIPDETYKELMGKAKQLATSSKGRAGLRLGWADL